MNTSIDWQVVAEACALGTPILFTLGALFSSRRSPFRSAIVATSLAVGLSLLVALATSLAGSPDEPRLGVRLGLVTSVMLLLVTCLSLAIVRYSRTYLGGDPGVRRYARWLSATMAAVTTLIVAENLLVIAVAWTATSLALHQLLTFYERPAALVAAHKKFLSSRLADVCLIGALGLVYYEIGSLSLSDVDTWAGSVTGLPTAIQVAALLFAVAACIKSAQIPLHGWLTQVMEAPTPVSALLHAGVVNIGGFLMIRLAPLMVHASAGQLVLVIVGMATALLASLIMTTRVSIKVSLAWSTCAQMGLMLVQCGLGAWHLALLHLVAHSVYKAHAFLSSGSTVHAWRLASLAPSRSPVTLAQFAVASSLALALVAGVGLLAPGALGVDADLTVVAFALLIALALVPMFCRGLAGGPGATGGVLLQGLGLTGLFFGWHAVAAHVLPIPTPDSPPMLAATVVAAGFLVSFLVQSVIQLRPEGRLARTLHRWLFAGLFLDERITRLVFHVWPPRLRARSGQRAAALELLEA